MGKFMHTPGSAETLSNSKSKRVARAVGTPPPFFCNLADSLFVLPR